MPEACLVAEGQPPHPRVQPVGADHQAEAAWRAVLEADLDAVAVRVQGADRVTEPVRDVVARGLVQDRGELPAHDLHVPLGDPRRQLAEVHLDRGPAWTLEGDPLGPGAGGQHLGQDAHPLGHVDGRPNRSTACPPRPARSAGVCSTTEGVKP
ncbi:MAG TPA: hypothetical protein VF880_10670 [Actinomycetes bacterium]